MENNQIAAAKKYVCYGVILNNTAALQLFVPFTKFVGFFVLGTVNLLLKGLTTYSTEQLFLVQGFVPKTCLFNFCRF